MQTERKGNIRGIMIIIIHIVNLIYKLNVYQIRASDDVRFVIYIKLRVLSKAPVDLHKFVIYIIIYIYIFVEGRMTAASPNNVEVWERLDGKYHEYVHVSILPIQVFCLMSLFSISVVDFCHRFKILWIQNQ